jgi:protein phosphatase
MRIGFAGLTHVGLQRTANEDAFLLLPEEGLFCVADGMGGHASGEVASRIAVEEMAEFYRLTGRDPEATWPFAEDRALAPDENRLVAGVRLANLRIWERAGADAGLKGMGTTLVCAAVNAPGGEALVGHVGDSRAYLLRNGALSRLTRDHSLLEDLQKARPMTQAEIEAFPHKNVILRALGMNEKVAVDLQRVPLQESDLLLLCCDGLHGMVPDGRLAELLRAGRADLARACASLIDAANAAGGADNITCVLVQVQAGAPAS